ncbi:hypothetical protein CPC08DRAFT_396838 [Agrocybe pediades]|nr:hypothetical protein CPC08DRAFT_396838 [Agrocybe pediades]
MSFSDDEIKTSTEKTLNAFLLHALDIYRHTTRTMNLDSTTPIPCFSTVAYNAVRQAISLSTIAHKSATAKTCTENNHRYDLPCAQLEHVGKKSWNALKAQLSSMVHASGAGCWEEKCLRYEDCEALAAFILAILATSHYHALSSLPYGPSTSQRALDQTRHPQQA